MEGKTLKKAKRGLLIEKKLAENSAAQNAECWQSNPGAMWGLVLTLLTVELNLPLFSPSEMDLVALRHSHPKNQF